MNKSILLFTISVLTVLAIHAKTIADTIPQLSNNQNYIFSQIMLDSTGTHVMSEINYFDGLGRPSQVVRPFTTPSKGDISVFHEYDSIGRLWKEWLPAVVYDNNGRFVNNIEDKLRVQYEDTRPFSTIRYEDCPLDRIRGKKGPGMDWPDYIWQSIDFWTGRKDDDLDFLICKYYEIKGDTLIYNSDYEDGELFVIQDTDEDENIVYTYYDKLERIVLTRQVSGVTYGSTFYDTYYIYDDFNNLRYVLLPMYQENPDLDLCAYQYKYDCRNQCIGKKTPGADWISYVYDKVGHLTYSQDGTQRQRKEWTYHLFDNLNREVISGVGTFIFDTVPDISNTVIKAVRYDYPGATGVGYLVYNWKGIITTKPLIVRYYDDYNFLNMKEDYESLKYGVEDLPALAKEDFVNANSLLQSTKGMLTGIYVSTPGVGKGIMKAMYYDDKRNVIQTRSTSHFDGYYKDWFSYSYSGLMLKHLHTHSESNWNYVTELYEYTYDHATRLKQVDHTLNNFPKVTIAAYTYDELGRLSQKALHNGQFVQSYTYNIRNWLTSASSPFFEQKLYYMENTEGNTPRYNGNISSVKWKVKGDVDRGYNYHYDKFNRLVAANYREDGLFSPHYDAQYSYDSMGNLTKILRKGLINKKSDMTFGEIDNLYLTYHGNQLKQVTDSAGVDELQDSAIFGFKDGVNVDEEYAYDKNGNLIKDLNKGIIRITYNSLNLPDTVLYDNKHAIYYHYGSDGNKYRVIHKDSVERATDYCGNAIYENNVLKKVLMKEGFITFENKTPVYHYYLSDHLGNNRVVIRQDSVMEQVNHYYPFGGLFGESVGGQVQEYKYNGKELDTSNNLNWYDYGARMYDVVLGRWHVADPFSEKNYNQSLYAYCKNNPVLRVDLDGKDDYVLSDNGVIYLVNKNDRKVDMLYASGQSGLVKQIDPKWNNIRVFDKSFLPGFKENYGRDQRDPQRFSVTNSVSDAANVGKFAMDNTRVEWTLNAGYKDGKKTYILGTSRREDKVKIVEKLYGNPFAGFQKVVSIHSHPAVAGTKGGSEGDMKNAKGMNDISFSVYFKWDKTLYEYDDKNSNKGSLGISSMEDLMKYILMELRKAK